MGWRSSTPIAGTTSTGRLTVCHQALMDRVRQRVGDKRVLTLVKAFLKAGIPGEDVQLRHVPCDVGAFRWECLWPLA